MSERHMPGAIYALKKITFRDVIKGALEREEIELTELDGNNQPVKRKVSVAKAMNCYVVFGRAHAHRSGSTSLGDFIEFIGTFEARRISDGAVFQSTRCIFPPIAGDLATEAYMRAKREDESALVDMAFVVGIEPDGRAATGYKFTCMPVQTGEAAADPLEELRSSLAVKFAANLGEATMAKLGLPMPGQAARAIAAPKGGKKEPEPA